MKNLSEFNKFRDNLKNNGETMPALFMGHGSPVNGIQENEFSLGWKKMAGEISRPKAVIVISAHWLTNGTSVTAMDFPDMVPEPGFPQAWLDSIKYSAPGDPKLAEETASLIHTTHVGLDHEWGLDHGAWMLVRNMYPKADIPVLQLSIDYTKGAQYHYDLAKELAALRQKGILIIGSGNIVHNLPLLNWDMINGGGFDWAYQMNDKFKELIKSVKHDELINYRNLGREAMLAIPTPDHYIPLIYILGMKDKNDDTSFFNDKVVGGSLTMTSVRIG